MFFVLIVPAVYLVACVQKVKSKKGKIKFNFTRFHLPISQYSKMEKGKILDAWICKQRNSGFAKNMIIEETIKGLKQFDFRSNLSSLSQEHPKYKNIHSWKMGT